MEIKFAMINQHCPNALIENGLHIVCTMYMHLRWTYKQNDVDQTSFVNVGPQQGPTNDNQQSIINYNNNFKVIGKGWICVLAN